MNNEILIKEHAAKALNEKLSHIKVLERLVDGRSHLTYLLEINDQKIVYRIVGKDGNLFVERKQEFDCLELIKNLDITSKTLYFDVETGEKASVFIEGSTLMAIDFRPHLREIADIYHRLHQIPIENIVYLGLVDRLDLYESYTNLRTPKYSILKEWWINEYRRSRAQKPKVFCHNDAQKANIVINDKQIYLLDFEYAGPNEFYYDIACFGNHHIEDAFEFLDAYLGRKATQEEQNIVRFYRLYQALMWHQVALKKELSGLSVELNMNFKEISFNFLKLADQLYHEIKG